MAFEDAGILGKLLKHFCLKDGKFSLDNFDLAMQKYEEIRIPRTRQILGASKTLGATQQNRAESWIYNYIREWIIWIRVKIYGTLPIMFPGLLLCDIIFIEGATYEYDKAVEQLVKSH